MTRSRSGKVKAHKIKKIQLKAKHARAVRMHHILGLIVFLLIGLGALLAGFSYMLGRYHNQQSIITTSREQLDYGAYAQEPIDGATLVLLTGGIVLAILGTTATIIAMIKHSSKYHVYKVASGHFVPVPARLEEVSITNGTPFVIGQSDESVKQAQASVRQTNVATDDLPLEQSASTQPAKQTVTIKVNAP